MLQVFQWIIDGRFHEFDYLKAKKNYLAYGQRVAPDYPIQNITSRNIVLFRGPNDNLSTELDQIKFVSQLRGWLNKNRARKSKNYLDRSIKLLK